MRITSIVAAVLLTAACSSGTTVDASRSDIADVSMAPDVIDAVDVAPDLGLLPDGAVPHAFQVRFPSTMVTPSMETTLCIQVHLGNPTPQYVRHGHVSLAPGSHHLIVYRMPAGSSVFATSIPCSAFSGVAQMAPAMLMAQAAESDLVIPDGVDVEIDANQIVRIEEHFINTTAATIQGTGTVTFDTIDRVPGVIPANMFFWGPLGINIAPHAMGSVDYFHPVQSGVNIFALSTHQHHLGTLATVSQTPDPTMTGTLLYRNTSWAEPRLQEYMPPVSFDGTTGVALHCEWNNTTSMPVMWGESAATDEMCFVGGYYYPSHGFDYCIDSSCATL